MIKTNDLVKVAISRGVYKKAQVQMCLNGYALVLFDNDPEPKLVKQENIKPLKSGAEEQIEAICHTFITQGIDFKYISGQTVAEVLYNAGCRMTHKLTDDVIAELCRKHLPDSLSIGVYHFAEAIENIILGEN